MVNFLPTEEGRNRTCSTRDDHFGTFCVIKCNIGDFSSPTVMNGTNTFISLIPEDNGGTGYPSTSTGGPGGNGSCTYNIQQGVDAFYSGSAGGNGGTCFANSNTEGTGTGTAGTPGASYVSGTPGSTGTSTPAVVPIIMEDGQSYVVSAGQESEAASPAILMVYYSD